MTFDPIPYQLLPTDGDVGALLHWAIVVSCCMGIVLVISVLTSLGVWGVAGVGSVGRQISEGLADTLGLSPRRTWALTRLTFKEAVRRKSLLVFVVFALLFMFAGWFLSDTNPRANLQVKVYVSFVLTAISWLILPVMLLLACWSLPEDIKSRTLHTVVTKPARKNEIVLGRMLGFVLIGTVIVSIMGGVGYFWIIRELTSPAAKARLVCRVPVYGQLAYLNREGMPSLDKDGNPKGLNVGDPWMFRGYIEGATKARAIWKFEGITKDDLIDGKLRLESRFEAFRTHKGVMGKQLLARFEFVNEKTNLRIPLPAFQVSEYGENITIIDEELKYTDREGQPQKTAKLFDDLILDGKLQIEVACLDSGQYLGMARPDLFLRTPDRTFASGFFKALLGIWLMMVLIVMLGVTASCFVKGPVAVLLTFTLIIIGQGFREFMETIVSGDWKGGGPIESVIKILKHMNPQNPLQEGMSTTIVQTIDAAMKNVLWLVQQVIPNFQYYSQMPKYVANGFDVNFNSALLPSIVITLAYLIPCLLIGHYSLRLRELEAK